MLRGWSRDLSLGETVFYVEDDVLELVMSKTPAAPLSDAKIYWTPQLDRVRGAWTIPSHYVGELCTRETSELTSVSPRPVTSVPFTADVKPLASDDDCELFDGDVPADSGRLDLVFPPALLPPTEARVQPGGGRDAIRYNRHGPLPPGDTLRIPRKIYPIYGACCVKVSYGIYLWVGPRAVGLAA